MLQNEPKIMWSSIPRRDKNHRRNRPNLDEIGEKTGPFIWQNLSRNGCKTVAIGPEKEGNGNSEKTE